MKTLDRDGRGDTAGDEVDLQQAAVEGTAEYRAEVVTGLARPPTTSSSTWIWWWPRRVYRRPPWGDLGGELEPGAAAGGGFIGEYSPRNPTSESGRYSISSLSLCGCMVSVGCGKEYF